MTLPILYIKPGCPWCDEVVDYLARKGIETRIVIVSGNPEAMREMVALSGQSKAPTKDWHGEVLADFGVDELVPFLKKRGLEKDIGDWKFDIGAEKEVTALSFPT